MVAHTLYDKLWQEHLVTTLADGTSLLYVDRQLLHEITSPQAFDGLRQAKRTPWRPAAHLAVPDHGVPTKFRAHGMIGIHDPIARTQVQTLTENCTHFGIELFELTDKRQGIVHVVGPEQGITLPGITIVCGDSHTSTHGALATLAMGIGTSEVEHVLATQTLRTQKLKNMRVTFSGALPNGIGAKDLILALIRKIGTAGGRGYAIEYTGNVVSEMSIEARMTLCNMTIEAGARAGLVAYDSTTAEYVRNRPRAPKGAMLKHAMQYWETLHSDNNAVFDSDITINVNQLAPQVTWGTSPEMVIGIDECIPELTQARDNDADGMQRALHYMGLTEQQSLYGVPIDKVFIGSCTNARIEDLRAVAALVAGHTVAKTVQQAIIVPGSGLVKEQAELEGLADIFSRAGFEWRDSGCSMCLGMNNDKLGAKERCAATSNRNFEGRQGKDGRTHLMSPVMAAAAAITGHITDVREML